MDASNSSKSELAYRFLLKQIVEAKIPPNAPIRIQPLGKESGLGATPIREALRQLESEKFVVMENNRGFRAAPVTQTELADLEKCRLVVETALMVEAMKQGDDRWEGNILSAHHLLSKAPNPTEVTDFEALRTWSERHREFHKCILSAANSPWLKLFYDQISNHLDRHFFSMFTGSHRDKYLGDDGLLSKSRSFLGIEHHTLLMNAVIDRDEAKAKALLIEHVGFTREFFDEVEGKSN